MAISTGVMLMNEVHLEGSTLALLETSAFRMASADEVPVL